MGLSFLGQLVDPTNEYKSEMHRLFSHYLVVIITLIVGNVTTFSFIFLGVGLPTLWYNILQNTTGAQLPASSSKIIGLTLLFGWCLVEVCFYFYCQYLRKGLESIMTFPLLTPEDREYYAEKVMKQCADIRKALVRWFYTNPPQHVGVECLKEWLIWALFFKQSKDVTKTEREEAASLAKKILEHSPKIHSHSEHEQSHPMDFMRLHFDTMCVQHKPFIAYVVISIMQGVGSLYLSYLGFDYHTISETSSLSYWTYHLSDDNNEFAKPPIFFVHGIGIGIAMYYKIMRALVANDPNKPIIILELPNISLKVMRKIPTTEETVKAIDHIFRVNNLTQVGCSWLAHSYGTIVTTWVIKDRPHYVKKITFVDPVCFALWEADLIYNFLYRIPSSSIQRLAQFFVAQDLVVASTLFKNFCWLRNVLFPEDIHCEADVFVSSHDFIIDPVSTYNYLKRHNEQTSGNKIRITKMHGLSHGSFLSSNKYTGDIMSCL